MSNNALAKQGTVAKGGIAVCGVLSIVFFMKTWWFLGILGLVGVGYFFFQLLKNYAARGKRL